MSTVRTDYGVTYDVKVGSTKTLEVIIVDPDTGEAKSLADTAVYATGIAKIIKADGTQVGANMTISFGDASQRLTGLVTFTVLASSQTLAANAGNWKGEIEISNTTPLVVDQQDFNINIKE
ncbi:hypothetical protein [Nitrosopumilus sp.]|uniref:hypothetical protein n=1 Tax=Nitrosopumilus sp. TaxID=2024843 RepID=UPI003D0B5EA7